MLDVCLFRHPSNNVKGRWRDSSPDAEDVDGSPLIDNTALVLAFEGGWGFDLEAGVQFSPHSTENMVMLVGGKAGGLNATPGEADPG